MNSLQGKIEILKSKYRVPRKMHPLAVTGRLPMDVLWDEEGKRILISQNNRIEEFSEDWKTRDKQTFQSLSFAKSPYLINVPGFLYCAATGGTNRLQKVCKKSGKVEAQKEFPFLIHEIKKLSGDYMIAKCSGNKPCSFLAVIDLSLEVADIIENLPVVNVTLAPVDENRVLLMEVAEMSTLNIYDYSVKEKKALEVMTRNTTEHRHCRSVLLHEDLYYIGGDGLFMCLDKKMEIVFYQKYLSEFALNLLKVERIRDKTCFFAISVVNDVILKSELA